MKLIGSFQKMKFTFTTRNTDYNQVYEIVDQFSHVVNLTQNTKSPHKLEQVYTVSFSPTTDNFDEFAERNKLTVLPCFEWRGPTRSDQAKLFQVANTKLTNSVVTKLEDAFGLTHISREESVPELGDALKALCAIGPDSTTPVEEPFMSMESDKRYEELKVMSRPDQEKMFDKLTLGQQKIVREMMAEAKGFQTNDKRLSLFVEN